MATAFGDHVEFDTSSEALIIQLQLEDLERMHAASKGKSREGELSDYELALDLQKQNLDTASTLLSDRRMTRSIARAVITDGAPIAESLSEEGMAAQDLALARRLEGLADASDAAYDIRTARDDVLDDEMLEKLAALYVEPPCQTDLDHAEDEGDPYAEPSSWGAGRQGTKPVNRRCVACREEKRFFNVGRVPCQHEYCRDCLKDLIETSMRDEAYFPPRCCRQPFSIDKLRMLVPSDLVKAYERKRVEFETPNRTYCHVPTCSAFISVNGHSSDTAYCPHCGNATCTICKSASHEGDCPEDAGVQQLLAAADGNGWQRCFSCRRVVELHDGCNHMTYACRLCPSVDMRQLTADFRCRCGAEFCYICGNEWRTCECDRYTEDRLRARANHIFDRNRAINARRATQPGNPPAPQDGVDDQREAHTHRLADEADVPHPIFEPPPQLLRDVAREAEVARIAQDLRENHECNHERWRYVQGAHRCEECFHNLPKYIFVCQQCQVMACWRCRRNRL